MKSPVSLEYVIAVTLLAVSAAVLSYVMPNPVFNLAVLLLGVYALHLVSVRVLVRQYAGVSPATGSRAKRATGIDLEAVQIREELDLERRELENQKTELQQRIVAAEQQWELLRQMIRDRVEGGAVLPDSVAAAAQNATASKPSPGRSNGSDDQPRMHGRW